MKKSSLKNTLVDTILLMRTILFGLIISCIFMACSTNEKVESGVISTQEEADVRSVLLSYKNGIEQLSSEGMAELFYDDSKIYESGGDEGTFEHYMNHHLAPELELFESFKFENHHIEVKVDLPYAFTTETYSFRIVLKENSKVIERYGVATSVLKTEKGKWKILKTHSSSRAISANH